METTQTQRGGLQIGVYDTSIAIPIENARVTFSELPDGENLFTTNSSGQTEIISLEAPPIDYSLTPDMPKPF